MAVVTFSPPIGVVVASWNSPTVLVLRVDDVTGVDVFAALIGVTTARVAGVRSASGLSPELAVPPVLLSGTWGDAGPPLVESIAAVNTGGQVRVRLPAGWIARR